MVELKKFKLPINHCFCDQWTASEKCDLATAAECRSQPMEHKFEGEILPSEHLRDIVLHTLLKKLFNFRRPRVGLL
jgi:hypothetical protein